MKKDIKVLYNEGCVKKVIVTTIYNHFYIDGEGVHNVDVKSRGCGGFDSLNIAIDVSIQMKDGSCYSFKDCKLESIVVEEMKAKYEEMSNNLRKLEEHMHDLGII